MTSSARENARALLLPTPSAATRRAHPCDPTMASACPSPFIQTWRGNSWSRPVPIRQEKPADRRFWPSRADIEHFFLSASDRNEVSFSLTTLCCHGLSPVSNLGAQSYVSNKEENTRRFFTAAALMLTVLNAQTGGGGPSRTTTMTHGDGSTTTVLVLPFSVMRELGPLQPSASRPA